MQLNSAGVMNSLNSTTSNMGPPGGFPVMQQQQQQQQQVPALTSGAGGLVAALMDELKHLRVLVEEKRAREAAAM